MGSAGRPPKVQRGYTQENSAERGGGGEGTKTRIVEDRLCERGEKCVSPIDGKAAPISHYNLSGICYACRKADSRNPHGPILA